MTMIKTRDDLKFYLYSDKLALGIGAFSIKMFVKEFFFPNRIYQFERSLRRCEYHKNNINRLLSKVLFLFEYFFFIRLSLKLGFTIPLNVFGPGLAIVHYGTIVVSNNSKVGANCRVHPSTCIGASGGKEAAPIIGDNVYIGPGAKIYGDIKIANNTIIAANASVGSSIEEEGLLIGGVPAKKIKQYDVTTLIKHIKVI